MNLQFAKSAVHWGDTPIPEGATTDDLFQDRLADLEYAQVQVESDTRRRSEFNKLASVACDKEDRAIDQARAVAKRAGGGEKHRLTASVVSRQKKNDRRRQLTADEVIKREARRKGQRSKGGRNKKVDDRDNEKELLKTGRGGPIDKSDDPRYSVRVAYWADKAAKYGPDKLAQPRFVSTKMFRADAVMSERIQCTSQHIKFAFRYVKDFTEMFHSGTNGDILAWTVKTNKQIKDMHSMNERYVPSDGMTLRNPYIGRVFKYDLDEIAEFLFNCEANMPLDFQSMMWLRILGYMMLHPSGSLCQSAQIVLELIDVLRIKNAFHYAAAGIPLETYEHFDDIAINWWDKRARQDFHCSENGNGVLSPIGMFHVSKPARLANASDVSIDFSKMPTRVLGSRKKNKGTNVEIFWFKKFQVGGKQVVAYQDKKRTSYTVWTKPVSCLRDMYAHVLKNAHSLPMITRHQ